MFQLLKAVHIHGTRPQLAELLSNNMYSTDIKSLLSTLLSYAAYYLLVQQKL